ncbi:TlpA disulfide reductase family protein [Parabacteroides sp. PF5-9]|uniref:TlpA family protein disulfide reductase n=1 Tax=Parabacteroides sp. PF5-9 TaxID=1742404 RepID=UPI002474B937|nr:TlpA disulfide reductase family protein [Parabacteroides sp. PF5-9]
MRTSFFICLFLLTAFIGNAQNDNPEIVKIGDIMPEFTIISDDGTEFKSTTLKGKVILVNFFATWCPPCQKELAAVQETLWPKYQNNPDFALLVIGREHNNAELKTYNEKKGFTFPLYPDKSRAIYASFANSLIPRSYLIGKDGKVKHIITGYTEEEFSNLMSRIENALK